jgi:hypothetical protein
VWTWQNQTCVACGVGFFKESPGLHDCSACPSFTTSFEGAAEEDSGGHVL